MDNNMNSIDLGPRTRKERRRAASFEGRALRGAWGDWRRTDFPHGPPGEGWLRDVRWTMVNDLYAVLCRPLQTEIGDVVHCAIRTASSLEPPWRDMQRIKDELFGPDRCAVEVMPPRSRVVDAADMYHMWVFPDGFEMPFCLSAD